MKKIIILLFLVFGSQFIQAQNKFEKLWDEVVEFELEGKYKSASEVVTKILKKANRSQKSDQILKSLIYKSKFSLLLEEDAQEQIVLEIEGYIKESEFPTNNILASVYAEFLQQYFVKNRYRISDRTKINNDEIASDFKNWDTETFLKQIANYYNQSLQRESELKKLPIKNYKAILTQSKTSEKFRPTLYDFLVHRSINFYKVDRWYVTQPTGKFQISNEKVFATSNEFVKEKFYTLDSIFSNRNVLKLFQKLELFHQNKDTIAYVDVVLSRLKFSLDNTTLSDKKNLYKRALENLSQRYKNQEIGAIINYQLSNFYYKESEIYHAKNDSVLKSARIKALKICDDVIEKYPYSDGGFLCKILKNKIEEEFIEITTEENVTPNKPFLGKVVFKGVDSLYVSVYKIPYQYFQTNNKYLKDSLALKVINANKQVSSTLYKLQSVKNYYKYSTEIILPELSIGNYLIVSSKNKNSKTLNDIYGYGTITSSNLTMVTVKGEKEVTLRFLDRETGAPLPKVKVGLNIEKLKSSKNETNKYGEYYIKKDKDYHNNIKIMAVYKSDTLVHNQFYINRKYNYENNDENIAKMTLFLDRSIYRPGQTIYFKGLLFENKKGKTKVVPNVYTYVAIYDANGDEIKEYRLKTNEYGSISGEFKLPSNILTGEFSIEMDEDYGDENDVEDPYWEEHEHTDFTEIYFSVEEYKRPQFEVSFNEVNENYIVGDSISISGNAKAFLGSNVSDAAVEYSITRTLVGNYYSNNTVIKSGSLKTDNEGNFKVTFIAFPDSLINKKTKPIFSYSIKADVTDINGETQSKEKAVFIGYHNLKVSVVMSNKMKSDLDQVIQINTQNLNGKLISAAVNVKIYKLKEPNRVLRIKPWALVELQTIPKKKYIELFPHELYDSLELQKNWYKNEKVFTKSFNTADEQKMKLQNISTWEPGTYLLEVSATDIFKDTVNFNRRFEILNPQKPNLSNGNLFNYELVNTSYKKDKNVSIRLNTLVEDLNIMLEVTYKDEVVFKKNINIKNNTIVAKIPVYNKYKDNININLSAVKYNSFYTEKFTVNFPEAEKELMVETISFRNKLTPDQKETWSFKIADSNGKNAEAEVLASMYDASLDKFKEHYWVKKFGFRDNNYWYYSGVSTYGNFSTTTLKNFIQPRSINSSRVLKNYHQINWYGFNFGNTTYKNNIYLTSINSNRLPKGYIEGNINGVITDDIGMPLPGVNVLVKGTSIGTQTDFDGFYSINASVGSQLVFSYVGFVSSEIKVNKSGIINWAMTEDDAVLDEVVITAMGIKKEKKALGYAVSYVTADDVSGDITRQLMGKTPGVSINQEVGLTGASNNIVIRGMNSFSGDSQSLFIIDGVPMDLINSEINIDPNNIESIDVLKGKAAISLYGTQGKNGVIIITTKKALEALTKIEPRKNLKETAFFFPHLTTNKKGEVSFNFNSPQALTKWKFMLLAHNKNLEVGALSRTAITQKDISIIPNTPRFLREKDTIVISAKISNLTSETQNGLSQLMLFDAITRKPIDGKLMNFDKTKNITIPPNGNIAVSWKLVIPENLQALEYKIVAKSGTHSDGESNVLPVLTNRILITEANPLWVQPGKTKTITFEKLKNNSSSTLKNHQFTLEYTSNPAWLAIQSLPYLMEFPHECAEQTFARYYSNALASSIINKDQKIKEVFDSWRENGSLESALDKNEELKSILISETPWVRDASTEKEKKNRLANLFEEEKVKSQQLQAINKLHELQMSSGGFPWFSGGKENVYITQHILSGIGHLNKLTIKSEYDYKFKNLTKKAIEFIDSEFSKNYNFDVQKSSDSLNITLSHLTIQYLYTRSFYLESHPLTKNQNEIINKYLQKCKDSWLTQPLYSKGMIALVLSRMNEEKEAKKIIEALGEQAVHSEENGMYWKENTASWYWYQSPIETQALLIEAFAETENNVEQIDQLKMWLLKNKRTNQWSTTKATTEAVYALLMTGNDWLSVTDNTMINIGGNKIKTKKLDEVLKEAGTGYMKLNWNENEITTEMATVSINNKSTATGYGGVYWQYFEELDAITSTSEELPLRIKKAVFVKKITENGEELIPVSKSSPIKIGDLLTVRLEIVSSYDMEFIHLKDLRASGLEPIDVLSQYKWQDGLGYYQSTKDVATHFFFDNLPKGKYVFEYNLRANNLGDFSNGITTIQSMYAPEFTDHSKGIRIRIEE